MQVDGIRYFAPLSSFKPKHKKMREGVDFIKIKDYSVININNMIPVPEGCYRLVDVNGEKDPHYKYLLQAEVREINRQRNRILKNASIVGSSKFQSDDSSRKKQLRRIDIVIHKHDNADTRRKKARLVKE